MQEHFSHLLLQLAQALYLDLRHLQVLKSQERLSIEVLKLISDDPTEVPGANRRAISGGMTR